MQTMTAGRENERQDLRRSSSSLYSNRGTAARRTNRNATELFCMIENRLFDG